MENKFNFVRNGTTTNLPLGFRFQPTDEELVFQYLKCKIFSLPLPASIIPEINVSHYDPWDLPGDFEQEKYFFSSKEVKYRNGVRTNRATSSGYWKASGVDKKIASSSTRNHHQMVGMRKTLVFHEGKPPHRGSSRTDWIMHEYRLSVRNHDGLSQIGNWVLCHVFLRKTSETSSVSYGSSTSSCSSSSSTITIEEVSSSELDYEETSSCNSYDYLFS